MTPTIDTHALLGHHYRPGAKDSITDVAGVLVGHATIDDGADIHTGVTAIVPTQLGRDRRALPAGLFVGNGYGKLIGATQVVELGSIETPILLTATLSAFRAADALVTWVLARPGYERTTSLNPVVGECNDGFLSDIRARPVTAEHVLAALDTAGAARPSEGCVGAGTGMRALGFKGGVGTASRECTYPGGAGVVGVIALSNFTGTLRLGGQLIPPPDPDDAPAPGNSCILVVATDLPVDSRQLGRIARRAVFAMGRIGADYHHGSGDYGLAFTTAPHSSLLDTDLNPVFDATMEATEAALAHSLITATTTVGHHGHTAPALTEHWALDRSRFSPPSYLRWG